MTNPTGEALLAVLGLDPLLGEGRLRLTVEKRRQAMGLRATIRKEVRRFIRAADFDDERPLPEFDYRKALERLTEEAPEQLADRLAGFEDPEEALAFVAAASRAMTYLRNVLRPRSRVTMTGPKPVPPSDFEVSRFRRALALVNDPLLVLEDLNEGTLARGQVRTLAEVFPGIYSVIKDEMRLALTDVIAERPRYEIPRQKARMLAILTETREWSRELAAMLQANFGKADPETEKPPTNRPLGDKTAQGMQTPVQRIATR